MRFNYVKVQLELYCEQCGNRKEKFLILINLSWLNFVLKSFSIQILNHWPNPIIVTLSNIHDLGVNSTLTYF